MGEASGERQLLCALQGRCGVCRRRVAEDETEWRAIGKGSATWSTMSCAGAGSWRSRHLESDHSDVVGQLAKHLPANLREDRIRPLGLDRFGLRLRVESDTGDHDVRLAFSRSVDSPLQLAMELRRLVGCPFLHGGS